MQSNSYGISLTISILANSVQCERPLHIISVSSFVMPPKNPDSHNTIDQQTSVVVMGGLISIGICVIFWSSMWMGSMLMGGDVLSYFMPQKVFYAQALQRGELPLWNSTTGHGYPVLGESQTGVLYPPNLILYSCFSPQAAYHISHILHYIMAFWGCILFFRKTGYDFGIAVFISIVFVYGWFPVRRCLEWAIITGAYLPWLFLCLEYYFASQKKLATGNFQSGKSHWHRGNIWLLLFSTLLGMQLLAGHYNIAFISLVAMSLYAFFRMCSSYLLRRKTGQEQTGLVPDNITEETASQKQTASQNSPEITALTLVKLGVAICLGFGLAAAQLLPSFELKANSQRRELTGDYKPHYGHLPPWYLAQMVMHWPWQSKGVVLDEILEQKGSFQLAEATNQVEAHFYIGLLPLALAILGMITGLRREPLLRHWTIIWMLMAIVFIILSTGLLMPWLVSLPGFSYFTGPGRYGLISQLALACLAGTGLMICRYSFPKIMQNGVVVIVCAITLFDLMIVSDAIKYTETLAFTPLTYIEDSYIKKTLDEEEMPARLFAPFANVMSMTGHSSTPVYLGIGPAEYWNKKTAMPEETPLAKLARENKQPIPGDPARITWLQKAGVTHIVSFEMLDEKTWPCVLLSNQPDAFLNSTCGRRREPVYFYKLTGTRGRVSWFDGSQGDFSIIDYQAKKQVLKTSRNSVGTLILTELLFPGWHVKIDGKIAAPLKIDEMYRGVEIPAGEHVITWEYAPSSFYIGITISTLCIVLLAIYAGMAICLRGKPA